MMKTCHFDGGVSIPNRIIKESICTSENLSQLSCGAERLFYRLIVQADDFGLMFANPKIVRSKCFPLIADDIKLNQLESWLTELGKAKLVEFYQVDGISYLRFTKWSKHQQRRATKPKYPLMETLSDVVQADDINGYQEISDDSKCPRDKREEISNKREEISNSNPTGGRPSVEEVREYCKERNNKVDAQQWYDFYSSKGWMIGKNPMKDWQACVRTWEKNDTKTNKPIPKRDNFQQREYDDDFFDKIANSSLKGTK